MAKVINLRVERSVRYGIILISLRELTVELQTFGFNRL